VRKKISVEIGSKWKRKKGHGWIREVLDMYTLEGIKWCRYVETMGNCEKYEYKCTVDAIKRWGNKIEE